MDVALESSPLADTADVLRALSDPTRLAITAMLWREKSALCVCHVQARFDLSQPTISHHLRALRAAKLVVTERRGTWIYYAIDRARIDAVPGLGLLLTSVATSRARDGKVCCR